MKRDGNRRIFGSFTAVLLIAVMIACFAGFSFSGCLLFGEKIESIEFRTDTIELSVGDSIEIDSAYVIIEPSTVRNKGFSISSSDEETVSVGKNNKITGVKEGSAVITAKASAGGLTATCTVSVSAQEPSSLSIEANGKLFQRAGEVTAVDFAAVFDILCPEKQVKWNLFLGGGVVDHLTAAQKAGFSFTPQTAYSAATDGVGLYTLKAETVGKNDKKLEAEQVIGVYRDYVVPPTLAHVSGNLLQEEGAYDSATFEVAYTDPQDNPERVTEWFVNGDSVQKGGKTFSYTPVSAGVYSVTARVNGEPLEEEFSVTAKGSIVPTGVTVDYDNCFPEVVLSWDSAFIGLDYEVEIRNAAGALAVTDIISTKNGDTASLFSSDKKSVKLGKYVGLGRAASVFNSSLSFRVRSLGDGKDFSASDYCDPVSVSAIGDGAVEYLNKKYYDGAKNFYITDEDEFVDLFAYLFMWRNSPVLKAAPEEKLSAEIYMAYTPGDMGELIEYAFDILHFTGKNTFEYRFSDNVLSLTIRFMTDSLPSKTYSHVNTGAYQGGSNAVRPHFNTDGSVRTSLPIESKSSAVTVTTSEQLYYVTQLGYKPKFVGNSTAKRIYDDAAFVLKRIISDDMTDAEKAHAIYDWVMLQVNYDHGVTNISDLGEAVKYSSYYLEGVFVDSGSASYAVCDGISKAYALMCNMENLACMRVAGMAGDDYAEESWGGHAWNKVKVDGEWYVVDCTWGDETMPLWDSQVMRHELAFHRYFLLTDREIERSHGEDQPNKYPRTAIKPYNWYDDEIEYSDGKTVDLYINSSEDKAAAEAEAIVDYFDWLRRNDPMYLRTYKAYEDKYLNCEYIAFDIRISGSLQSLFESADNPISAALVKLGYKDTDFKLRGAPTPDGYYMFVILRTLPQ